MQLRVRENRGVLAFALAMLLLMSGVAWMNAHKDADKEGSPSSYSALRRGGKAAFLLLQQSNYPVERWEKSPEELPGSAGGMLLVLAGPESYPRAVEHDAIVRFLLHGGRVLVAGKLPEPFVPRSSASFEEARVRNAESKPAAPTRLTRGGSISQDGSLVWDNEDDTQLAHFADGEGRTVVVSYTVGAGEVIWWASALPLTNAGIRDRGNLDLLLNSIGDSKRILWDEYYHTQHLMRGWTLPAAIYKWSGLQLGLLVVAVLLTFSRRSGPTVAWIEPSRLSPLEFVQTLASVFHRAKRTQVAVEIALGRFRQVAARRLGIRTSSSIDEILDTMKHRSIAAPDGTIALVQNSEQATTDPDLLEKSAVQHVRALNDLTNLLEPSTPPAKKP